MLKQNVPLRPKTPLKSKKTLRPSKTPKRQPKPSITLLRKKADRLFSKAVRYRDAELRDGEWWCQCITCSTWNPMKNTHCGHFQTRGRLATRWDYENCNAQCAGCNTYRGGEQYKYSLAIDMKYGDGTALKLHKQAKQDFRPNRVFLEEVISTAKTEIDYYESMIN